VVDIVSGVMETAAGCAFGRILSQGSATKGVKVPTADADALTLLGAVLRQDMQEPTTPSIEQKDAVSLVKKGRIWLEAAGTLTNAMNGRTDGTAVYLVHTGADAGLLSPTDDANTVRVYGIRVLRGATDGNLALVEMDL